MSDLASWFLSALDQTVVGTAIRTISDDFHGLSQQAWVTTAYLIVSTIATPIYVKLSDIFGRRPLFIIAIVVFIIGFALVVFATSMIELAAFRAIQGLGAGGLFSMPLAIMGDILAPRERAKYQGYFLAVFGISSLVGPLVRGIFAGADQILWIAGWRWVFLINIPLGLLALAVVRVQRVGSSRLLGCRVRRPDRVRPVPVLQSATVAREVGTARSGRRSARKRLCKQAADHRGAGAREGAAPHPWARCGRT